MANNNKTIIIKTYVGLAIALVIIGGLLWLANHDKGRDDGVVNEIAPAVLIADEVDSFNPELKSIHAICFANDLIYVLSDAKFIAFDNDNEQAQEYTFDDLRHRRCINVDSSGNIFVGSGKIEVISDQLETFSLNCSQASIITSIAISEDYIYAADAGQRAIIRFDRDDLSKDSKPEIFQQSFDIKSPYFDLTFANDTLISADPGRHNIVIFDEMNCELGRWGHGANCDEGFFGCCNPANFALLSDGRFVTVEKSKVRVKLYSSDGVYIGMIADSEKFKDHLLTVKQKKTSANHIALDVAVDNQDKIYIAEPLTSAIRIFELKK